MFIFHLINIIYIFFMVGLFILLLFYIFGACLSPLVYFPCILHFIYFVLYYSSPVPVFELLFACDAVSVEENTRLLLWYEEYSLLVHNLRMFRDNSAKIQTNQNLYTHKNYTKKHFLHNAIIS